MASALTWTGVVLLVVGASMAGPSLAPYVASRLQPLPAKQVLEDAESPLTPADPTATASTWLSEAAPLPLFDRVEAEEPARRSSSSSSPVPAGRPPTRIVIPSIGVDAQVVPTDWQTVDVGGSLQPVWIVPEAHLVGWHRGSAPLGVAGNTVLNGHNWPEDAVFRRLYQIEPGAEILLYSDDRTFTYRVAEVLLLREAGQPLEVRQANARHIQPTDDERVTLVTCHPYGQLTYRLIVIARPEDSRSAGNLGE